MKRPAFLLSRTATLLAGLLVLPMLTSCLDEVKSQLKELLPKPPPPSPLEKPLTEEELKLQKTM